MMRGGGGGGGREANYLGFPIPNPKQDRACTVAVYMDRLYLFVNDNAQECTWGDQRLSGNFCRGRRERCWGHEDWKACVGVEDSLW